jgi:hypothetical protein
LLIAFLPVCAQGCVRFCAITDCGLVGGF